jgi:tetratricopeptide (TPR) repeat protein
MRRRATILWAAGAILAAGAAQTFAQGRGALSIGPPGQIKPLGSSSPVTSFTQYSFGLGALEAPTVTSSANPLRSSIEQRAVYNIAKPLDVATVMGGRSLLTTLTPGARSYQPTVNFRPDLAAPVSYSGPGPLMQSRLLKATTSYLDTLRGEQNVGIATRVGPITSLASGQGDKFSTDMSQGEQAFRSGDFQGAMEHFKMANSIDPKNPESLLSLAHASFALSRYSYFRTSYYLTRALKYLPELPLAPLDPKSFFGSPEQYSERIGWLDKHLATSPFDNEAFFVAAYFRWFDGDIQGAQAALAKAGRGKISDDLREAIDTFKDGMKASGKVSGAETSLPVPAPAEVASPSSRPAAPAEPAGPAAVAGPAEAAKP